VRIGRENGAAAKRQSEAQRHQDVTILFGFIAGRWYSAALSVLHWQVDRSCGTYRTQKLKQIFGIEAAVKRFLFVGPELCHIAVSFFSWWRTCI